MIDYIYQTKNYMLDVSNDKIKKLLDILLIRISKIYKHLNNILKNIF